MELIVLGSSASYALPGEATSGYLIRSGDESLVIDLGNGALSNLFRWQDPADMKALILSHTHMDHVSDLYPLRLYLSFDRPGHKLTVIAPEGASKKLSSVLSPKGKKIFDQVLRFKSITEGARKIGKFNVSFAKMIHDIPSFAVKIEAGRKSLVYSSDTMFNDKLVKLATNTDLLLSEATLIKKVPEVDHMTVEETARLAEKAGAKKLVLTHIWPTFKDEKTVDEAAKYYSGPIEIANVNAVYKI